MKRVPRTSKRLAERQVEGEAGFVDAVGASLARQNAETTVGTVTSTVFAGFAGSFAVSGCVATSLGFASQATSKRMGPNGVM